MGSPTSMPTPSALTPAPRGIKVQFYNGNTKCDLYDLQDGQYRNSHHQPRNITTLQMIVPRPTITLSIAQLPTM